MQIDVQQKLNSNKQLLDYLHTHSYWYKYLNRNPAYFDAFVEEVKDTYKLRPSDKVNRILDTLEVLQTLMSTMQ